MPPERFAPFAFPRPSRPAIVPAMPILAVALLVAVLDGAFAVLYYVNVLGVAAFRRVWQSVASGWIGKSSFDGGAATVSLGLATHLLVALIWTLVYTFGVQRVAFVERLVRTPRGRIVVGVVVGAFIWCFMDFVVIPFSQAKQSPPNNWRFWGMLAWHMIGVGPPLVWFTRPRPARAAAALAPVP
jgi:hypothetical protein